MVEIAKVDLTQVKPYGDTMNDGMGTARIFTSGTSWR